MFYIDTNFWPLNTALYVRDFKGNEPRFVAGLLESLDLGRNDGAAAVPGVNRNRLHTLPVRCPDVATQHAIASILASIDDLTENNRRRIEVLEQMAKAICWEWFVRFRYPGHEDATFVDSTLGPIPDGWEMEPLADAAVITMGQSPRSEFYNEHGIGKPFHQGVSDFGPHFPTNRKYCTIDGRSAEAGDILVSVRAPVGRLNIALDDMTIGRGLAAVRSRCGRQSLLFRTLRDIVFADEDAMGGGTIFKAIGKKELEQLRVMRAPEAIERDADTTLTAHLSLVRTLTLETRRLATIRDLLLPKLVTGQIDVSHLDLDAIEASVA